MAQVYLAVREEGTNWILAPFDTAMEALHAVKSSATYGEWKILEELEIEIFPLPTKGDETGERPEIRRRK